MAAFPRAAAIAALFVLAVSSVVPASAIPSSQVVRTPADPAYVVSLRSNGDGTVWDGTMDVAFTNAGDADIDAIWMHLWGNGLDGCTDRNVRLTDIEHGVLGDLVRRCTSQQIQLPSLLAPGDRISLRLGVSIDVPDRNDRFGFHAGLSLMGNALPILGVTDDRGDHLDPYVHLGESFYSLAGRYRVTLNVPSTLETAATGLLRSDRTLGTRASRTYTALDVRDFAWAASTDLDAIAGMAGDTRVRVWFRPASVDGRTARDVLANAVDSMRTFSAAFGAYPHHEVDVVVSAFTTFGGMEYPQIVFSNPDRITVAHELAHQWWFAIVGNDEFTEPWLDESFATWSSYLPYGGWRTCRGYEWPDAQARITNDMGYWKDRSNDYFSTVYGGGGCMLANLSHRFGLQAFTAILARHATRHWLGVARTPDFKRLIERSAARQLVGFNAESYWSRWRVD